VQSQKLTNPFETVLRFATEWAREQEQRILREGQPLSADQIADARAAGVREPERVRVLPVDEIPAPPGPILKAVSAQVEFLPVAPSGLTFQYGIFLRADRVQDRYLVAHELVHTSQYERLGGIVPFLRDYIKECSTLGYRESSLEREANEIAAQICAA
jgi:hypothetical protein